MPRRPLRNHREGPCAKARLHHGRCGSRELLTCQIAPNLTPARPIPVKFFLANWRHQRQRIDSNVALIDEQIRHRNRKSTGLHTPA